MGERAEPTLPASDVPIDGTAPLDEPVIVAAVDLGSNSFHMLVAQADAHGLRVIDRLREPVRLAEGLRPDKTLSEEAQARALDCLSRFGQRIRDLPPHRVRIVGTNTLRRLRRSRGFIARAQECLGHRIEVIAGVEEARLIYGGVMHGLPMDTQRALVVDIGGGSTELIIGNADGPQLMESVHMGCVSYTQRFFGDGQITRKRLRDARLTAGAALKFLVRDYRKFGWDFSLGASGSVRAVWRVGAAMGQGEHHITLASINAIEAACLAAGEIDKLDMPGLRDDRRAVFMGSLMVLAGVFDALGVDKMEVSERALREGVIYDLLGRLSDADVRDRSTAALAARFKLDTEHAARVEQCAQALREQVASDWKLADETHRDMLSWAAQLHEIGMGISHSGYHKHSAYVLAQVDLHGFSRSDQQILAAIVRSHRGRWDAARFEELPREWRKAARRLAILLRVAVILNRGRVPDEMPPIQARAQKGQLHLQLPEGWLQEHALTSTDLESDALKLAEAGFTLSIT